MKQGTKNIILGAVFLLVAFLAYQYGISKTIAIRNKVSKLQEQKEAHVMAPAQLAALADKEKQLDAILKKNNIEGNSLQNNILKTLHSLSAETGFRILEFQEPHLFKEETSGQITTTYQFTIQGDYKSLIGVLYSLEQDYSFGTIVHTSFEKKKNFRTGRYHLQCDIYLQRKQ